MDEKLSPTNGNGNGAHHSPEEQLPSAAVPPPGGPVDLPAAAPAEKPAAPPVPRDAKGHPLKGHSVSPATMWKKGFAPNPHGVQNHNRELWAAIKKLQIADQKGNVMPYVEALLRRALQEPKLAEQIINKLFADATPAAEAIKFELAQQLNASANAGASATSSPMVSDDRLEELRDPAIRDALGDLVDRLAERRGITVPPRKNGN
jgi:hypothetical protein